MINNIIITIRYLISLFWFKYEWRKKNPHNYTTVGNVFPSDKVKIGNKTYGELNVRTYGNDSEYLQIGSYCSIAGDVKFLLGGEHGYKNISTYPFKKYIFGIDEKTKTKGPIIINDDVWIGENVIILSGVNIGQGAVIGAGSIVSKDVPPYAIYVGNCVKHYRFTQAIIQKMLEVDFSSLDEKIFINNDEILYEEINETNIQTIIDKLTKGS